MTDNAGVGGVAYSCKQGFTSADKMRLTSLTHKITEELRTRRDSATDSEKKIQKLLNDRFTMGWKLDQESLKLASLNEKHEAEQREAVRQMEEKIKDYQIEATQHQVYRTTAETEKETLKEEIRKLQLMLYSLEKKLSEYERQEKIHASQREEHIKQVLTFQRQHGSLDLMVHELNTKHKQLDHEVSVLKDLNKRLQYQNHHQQCILDVKIGELATLKQELLDTKIKVKVEPEKVKQREEDLTREITQMKCQTNQLEEENQRLYTEGDSWKQKYWDGLKRLDEAHRLLNVHLHNAAQFRDEHLSEVDKKKLLQAKLEATEAELEEIREKAEKFEEDFKQKKEAWTDEKGKLTADITDANKQLDESKEQNKAAEKMLEKSKTFTLELEEKLFDTQAILDVVKLNVESQTDLKMLEMLNCGTQITPETQCKELQAQVAMETRVTQTIDPAFCSEECQTDTDSALNTKSHNDVASQVDIETAQQGIQTDSTIETTIVLENNVKDIQSDKDIAVDNGLCQEENEEMHHGNVSYDNVSQNMADKIDDGNVGRSFSLCCSSVAKSDAEEESKDVLKGVTIVISDSEDESSHNKCEQDGDKTSDGIVYHNNFPPNTALGDTETLEDLSKTNVVEAKYIGLKVPNIDVKNIVGKVAVDPEEFSIELSQDKAFRGAATDCNNAGVYSDSHPENINVRNRYEMINRMEQKMNSNGQVRDEPSRMFKPKSRKHKLSKDSVDEHFSSFNMTKSMFETSAHYDAENEFQVKQPKLNKTKILTNWSSNKKPKQFSSMFQKPANVSENAQAEQIRKKSNVDDATVVNDENKSFSSKHNHHHVHALYKEKLFVPEETASSAKLDDKSEAIKVGNIRDPINDQLEKYVVPNRSVLSADKVKEQNISPSCFGKQSAHAMTSQPAKATSVSVSSCLAEVLPITETSAMPLLPGDSTTPLCQSETLLVHCMPDEATVGPTSVSTTSLIASLRFSERQHTPISTTYYYPTSTNSSLEQTDDLDAETDNDSERVATDTWEASRKPNECTDERASLISQVAHGQTHSVSKTSGSVLDKSSFKPRGSADVLQKYRDIVAKLKPSRSTTVTKVPSELSIVKSVSAPSNNSLLPSNSSVSPSNSSVSPGKRSVLPSNSSLLPSNSILSSGNSNLVGLEKKDSSREVTDISPSRGTTPGGILKGVRKSKKPSRNVTWNEYVVHKEFVTLSASEESSQETK